MFISKSTPNILRFTRRSKWLAARHKGIGSSDAPAIAGVSPWASPYSLWREKSNPVVIREETAPMRWGHLLEREIAREYSRQTKRKIRDSGKYTIHQHADIPWLQASLDREIVEIDDRGPGVLEVKNASAYRSGDWTDGAPLYYRVQVQHQLAVTGCNWGSLAVLIGGNDFRWMDIERNDAFISALINAESAFWNCVVTGTTPDVDGHTETRRVLRELHPDDNGESVALPLEFIDLHNERMQILKTIKEMEQRKALIDNKLLASIGGNSYGFIPTARYSLLTQERKEHVLKASRTRVLRCSELKGE